MSFDVKKLDLIFALRYAVRVLTRHAQFWRNVAGLLKFLSLLSGSLALASVVADKSGVALWLAVFFGIAQCLEHVLSPAEKALTSELQARRYAEVWASSSVTDTNTLQLAYERLVAADGISPAKPLQQLAYDDVVHEQGLNAAACYGQNRLLHWLS